VSFFNPPSHWRVSFCQNTNDLVCCEVALQKKDIVAAQAKANQIRKSVSANSPEQNLVNAA
jgi:hypothetical protein